jgi:predicted nucleic acid-binding protein
MSASRGLILDANILIRAVFGVRVREILEKYEDEAKFYTPDACFQGAQNSRQGSQV